MSYSREAQTIGEKIKIFYPGSISATNSTIIVGNDSTRTSRVIAAGGAMFLQENSKRKVG